MSRPGVYNLNRFRIMIKDRDDNMNLVSEVKLHDDILLHVSEVYIDTALNGNCNMIDLNDGAPTELLF